MGSLSSEVVVAWARLVPRNKLAMSNAASEVIEENLLRFDAARHGLHAPHGLCFCQPGEMQIRVIFDTCFWDPVTSSWNVKSELRLVPFDELPTGGHRRMCCKGMEQDEEGVWIGRDNIP